MTPLALVQTWLTSVHVSARLALYGSLTAAAIGGYLYWHHHVYQAGYDRAIELVAKQNKEALHAVDDARARVRDCNARVGMRWDQVAGECVPGT